MELLYGRGSLTVTPPAGCIPSVIAKRPMPLLDDPEAAVARALAGPVGARPLAELARDAASACILICDVTRPVPNGLFLGPLIRELLAAGLPSQAITVLVATGLHRPNLGDELAALVGDPWVAETVRVENHYARDDAAHVEVCTTTKGTRVRLDRRLVEADLRIATGLVEPHFMAGYSGGRKVIAPGVAHAETITTFHNARFMSHPRIANCSLDGNPLHEEQLEIVAALGGALAVNTVIDEERRLAFVNFGEVVESHLAAVEFIRAHAEVPVDRTFQTVVTSAAGYPLDQTYYQTVKGMVGPLDILAPGGDLIVVSECAEGLGSAEYREAQVRLVELGADGFWDHIREKPFADIDEWQTQMQLKPMRLGAVKLYSGGLSPADGRLTGVEMIASVEDAVADSMARHGDPHVAFVPEGPYVVPRHAV
ncbi:MAG: nickel-dependent lactate racemase [Alphaproteobacteria bacterium]|jgi:nickel-dependent lactate racemase|nr:nickel-dependent lactate racemase [Alphaproteobacteria bacterium]